MPEYVLKTVAHDMTSRNGFKWPRRGRVEAPDWDPRPVCGGGLHGFLRGEGDGGLAMWFDDTIWLVIKVDEWVDLDRKVKFPRGYVVLAGSREEATGWMKRRYPDAAVIGATVYAGDYGAATAGYRGFAKAGYEGSATAGYGGTAKAGDRGTAKAGDRGTASAGYDGTATAGYRGFAKAGYEGSATAGYGGTAKAGDRGTAKAGDRGTASAGYDGTAKAGSGGTASAGYRGIAMAGYAGKVMAGKGGVLILKDQSGRLVVGKVGDGELLPNTWYILDEGEFVQYDDKNESA